MDIREVKEKLLEICEQLIHEEKDSTSNITEYRNTEPITMYSLNGKPHRKNGPAIIHPNGRTEWYINGLLHREDGPAIEGPNGYKAWFKHGQLLKECRVPPKDIDRIVDALAKAIVTECRDLFKSIYKM